MPADDTPAAEVDIDAALVRALLSDQHPDLLPGLADGAIVELASGWDNVIFRLGHELIVRFPRRHASATLIENEQRWLPRLAATLPLPIPAPIAIGRPGRGFPWSWSVSPWLPGATAAEVAPADADEAARTLAHFLVALHQPAPADAPTNPVRGVPLADRAERLHAQLAQVSDALDARAVSERWSELIRSEPWTGPPLWLHGDLRPANVLVDHGRVSAVIDFGDITGGDPATDLAIAWMLFAPPARAVFRDAAGPDDATWARAQAWGLVLGAAFVASSANDPSLEREGRALLDAVLADPL